MTTVNLEDHEVRNAIAETISVEIDEWCEKEFQDGHRRHLGGSRIGRPCSRQLWYEFRWAKKEVFGQGKKTAGQVQRLFQRGHREEIVLTQYLTGIGCVLDYTPENQARIQDVAGHFGGSLDNVGTLPPQFGITEKILFEFKTAKTTDFNKMKKGGVKVTKPEHWSQICVYGYKLGLNYCLYIMVCKETDELHIELLRIDHEHGAMMIDKATAIISTNHPPQKISLSPANFTCKWCTFKQICHYEESVEINCRSCKHAKPLENGGWGCTFFNQQIPDDFIPKGCQNHEGIE